VAAYNTSCVNNICHFRLFRRCYGCCEV